MNPPAPFRVSGVGGPSTDSGKMTAHLPWEGSEAALGNGPEAEATRWAEAGPHEWGSQAEAAGAEDTSHGAPQPSRGAEGLAGEDARLYTLPAATEFAHDIDPGRSAHRHLGPMSPGRLASELGVPRSALTSAAAVVAASDADTLSTREAASDGEGEGDGEWNRDPRSSGKEEAGMLFQQRGHWPWAHGVVAVAVAVPVVCAVSGIRVPQQALSAPAWVSSRYLLTQALQTHCLPRRRSGGAGCRAAGGGGRGRARKRQGGRLGRACRRPGITVRRRRGRRRPAQPGPLAQVCCPGRRPGRRRRW